MPQETPMPEPVPALVLHRIRQHCEHAILRGDKLDPRLILSMARGEKA